MFHALCSQLCRLLPSLPLVHTLGETLLFRERLEKVGVDILHSSFALDSTLDLLICLSVRLRYRDCYRIILADYRRIRDILLLQLCHDLPCCVDRLNTGVLIFLTERSIIFRVDRLIFALFALTAVFLCGFCMSDLANRCVHHIIQHRNILL